MHVIFKPVAYNFKVLC